MFKRLGKFFSNKFSKIGSFVSWVISDSNTESKIKDEAAETADEITKIMEDRR